jgi:methylated-DNA-[protein]-cysteine S-methyltransferase
MKLIRECESPFGNLTLFSDGTYLTGVAFEEERYPIDRTGAREESCAVLVDAERQLAEYFGGWRKEFDLPWRAEGTEFQKRVWNELVKIPYGKTISYGELAERIGNRKGMRAVGAANGRNPIAIVVPCHRVIGADGSLTGYGGGMERKRGLLELEGVKRTQPAGLVF